MARPSKYNWKDIQKAYEGGISIDEISKKYNVTKKTLQNKISEKKWKVTGSINTHINGVREHLGKLLQETGNDPVMQDIVEERVRTILEDNELIQNNRKLLKAFQGLVGKGIREGAYKTPSDIKAGVSTIKDIEAVANPKANQVNIQNNQIVNDDNDETTNQIHIYLPQKED